MAREELPKNDGWTDIKYVLGENDGDNERISKILNEACHVFQHHAEGIWRSHYKDAYASKLANELRSRPSLAGRLLHTRDRVIKMLTHRALELIRQDSGS